MTFPELAGKKFGYMNLNLEAKEWSASRDSSHEKKNLLDPDVCQEMVEDTRRKHSVDFSYGGWMEDRSFLWHGSYLDSESKYMHLGIDINVPAGTTVLADFGATVIKVDDDYLDDGGWGPRLILKHATEPLYFIYAHLAETSYQAGDTIKKGDALAKIGQPPFNGNWFPHLHVQCISADYFEELEKNNAWQELDGYGTEADKALNMARFPDPTHHLSLDGN